MGDWLAEHSAAAAPPMSETALSLQDSILSTSLWPEEPIADLTGGKDSRVIAAAAISGGATKTVRTIRSDHGEVEVAKRLVDTSTRSIEHRIQEVAPPKTTSGGVLERLLSNQRVWEGHYIARSVYKAGTSRGAKPANHAVLNGMGGEAIQGGALMGGSWRERINSGGQAVAFDRLAMLVTGPRGTTADAKASTVERLVGYAREVSNFGWTHPESPINYVYNTDRMAHWAIPLGGRSTIIPFFAPVMLLHMARTVRAPRDYGGMHRELLQTLAPEWADVPFYKPSEKRRATSFMWQFPDWTEARGLVLEKTSDPTSFSRSSLREIVERVDAGRGDLADEATLVRALWELSFKEYISELRGAVSTLRRELGADVDLTCTGECGSSPP